MASAEQGPGRDEGLFRRFLDQLPVGVFVTDGEGRPFYANAASGELLGKGVVPGVASGQLAEVYRAFVAGTDDEYPAARMPVVKALSGQTSSVDDMEIARPDARVPIEVWATPIYDGAGRLAYAVAVFRDVTERRRAQAALEASEERFRAAFDNAPIGMALANVDGDFIEVNAAMCRITGHSEAQLVGANLRDVTHPDNLEADEEVLKQMLAGDITTNRLEERYLRPDGSSVWVLLARSLVTDEKGQRFLVVQVEDISARKSNEEELMHRALHDDLTGLPRRVLLEDRLRRALTRANRQGSAVGVLYLDLDGFKTVNDTLGHAAGDEVLVQVAGRLTGTLRATDTAARIGGDEFVVVCESLSNEHDASVVMRRIRAALDRPYELSSGRVDLRASVGGVLARGGEQGPDELIRRADAEMYEAKRRGQLAP